MLGKLKNIRGITLIALLITIVVMLILVSVSINIVTKEGGLLDQINSAAVLREIARSRRRS